MRDLPALGLVALLVRDYDEAKDFYLRVLGFELVEDTPVPTQAKRWVVVRPRGCAGASLLLAQASGEAQGRRIGAQTGGRVFLFLYTDNIRRDHAAFVAKGVEFVRAPEVQPHGTVAVFKDLYGNLWDLIEPSAGNRSWPVRASAPGALDAEVSLRSGTPDDATSIAALAIQVFLDTYAIGGVRPDLAEEAFHHYGAAAFSARVAEPERRFVLAEREDCLLGFAELRVTEEPAPAGAVTGAELVRLYVQPGAQRAGIGTALLARAEGLAAEAGLRFLWLTAWDGNARALAFYAARGYADMGGAAYSFQGRAYGNRVLAIRLPAG